jgi:hypothetical protein
LGINFEESMDSGFNFNPTVLKEALSHQLPAEPFEHLLRPIDLHVPLADFRHWRDHLRWTQEYDWGELTGAGFVVPTGILEALKRRTQQGRIDKWSRTIALLTMVIVTSSTGYAWSRDILDKYLSRGDQNFVDAVVLLLDALYQDRAQRAPAGPMAFYWLAQAALLMPSVLVQCKGPTLTYMQWMEHHVEGRARPGQEPREPDRVLAYLLGRISEDKSEVAYRQPRRLLSQRERLRLFFGENKNQWTLGAVLRVCILVLSLAILPLGIALGWQAHGMQQQVVELQTARLRSIDETRAEHQKRQSRLPETR